MKSALDDVALWALIVVKQKPASRPVASAEVKSWERNYRLQIEWSKNKMQHTSIIRQLRPNGNAYLADRKHTLDEEESVSNEHGAIRISLIWFAHHVLPSASSISICHKVVIDEASRKIYMYELLLYDAANDIEL